MMQRLAFGYLFLLATLTFDYSTVISEQETIYFFSHGIADSHRQAFRYVQDKHNPQKPYIITEPFYTFDYPDATTNKLLIKGSKACLAQDQEVVHLANHFYATIDPTNKGVLIGVSRGAAALVTFMAWYQPTSVPAIILESPFDSPDSIVSSLLKKAGISWIPGSHNIGKTLLCSIFKKYDRNGVKPIESARKIQDNLPILFVCSLKDKLVPAWSTMILYATLQEKGNNNVYILIVPEGSHARIIEHPVSGPLYQKVAHAFYRRYGLPHDLLLAQEGEPLLNDCQPPRKSLISYIPDYAVDWFKQWS